VRAQLDELVGSARAALTVVEVPVTGLLDALAGSPVALTTMGRGLQEDPAPFLAAAAGLLDALAGSPVALTTMGRGLQEDPAPFLAAAAAGAHAAGLSARP
jgi:hypothetical protein